MSFLAPIAQMVGALTSAAGTAQAGATQQQVAGYNATVANQNRTQAVAAGQTNAAIVGQQTAEGMGAAAAAYGAGGVTMSGSPLAVMASLASKGELSRRLAAYQGQVAATADTNEAALQTAQGRAASTAANTKAIGTLLTGTAQFAQSTNTLGWWSNSAGTSPAAT